MAFDFKKIFSAINVSPGGAPKSVVGIDFGSSSVKVVEIELDEVLRLKTYGELQLGPYAKEPLGSSVELSQSTRTEAIVDVFRESNVDAKNGVLTLPLSGSFITTVGLVAKKNEDIASRVHIEARKTIPVPLTDVALEWTEVDPLANTPENVREVLIAAIQNDILSESKTILESIKMVSQPSEIELFSALRALTKESDTSIAVLDFGAQTSKLYISQGGFLRRIHRVHSGGALATQRIAELLNVSFEGAENLKRNFSADVEHAEDIKKAVISSFERPLQEFKRVLNQYELKSGEPISRVVVTGGSSAFVDFIPFVDYALDKKTEKANPFTKIAYPAFMEDVLIEIAPSFTVALGAALRPFEQ